MNKSIEAGSQPGDAEVPKEKKHTFKERLASKESFRSRCQGKVASPAKMITHPSQNKFTESFRREEAPKPKKHKFEPT